MNRSDQENEINLLIVTAMSKKMDWYNIGILNGRVIFHGYHFNSDPCIFDIFNEESGDSGRFVKFIGKYYGVSILHVSSEHSDDNWQWTSLNQLGPMVTSYEGALSSAAKFFFASSD